MALHKWCEGRRLLPHRWRRPTWFILTSGLESVGDGITRSLLPIIAVAALGAGPAFLGVLNSLSLLGFLLLSLPLGALADRWSAPARLMSVSSGLRAGVMVLGVGSWVLGWLQGAGGMVVLLLMALVIGVADVAFTSGRGILIPRLVPADRIRSLVGRVQSISQVGSLAAPLVLSALLTVVAAPLAWLAAGAAYLVSLGTQIPLRRADAVEGTDRPRESLRTQMRQGFSHLKSVRQLRLITVANTLVNASNMVANTLLPVIALTTLGIAPAHFAALGSLGAVAGILGAAIASPITVAVGLRWARILTGACATIGVLIVLTAVTAGTLLPGSSLLWIAVQYTLTFFSTSLAQVAGADLIARLTPRESLGVVAGAQRTVVLGAMPASALAIGGLASTASLAIAIWFWLGLTALSLVPAARLKDPPDKPLPGT